MLYNARGCGSIPVSTLAMRGTKVQFITDWAQRVNGSYSLFNIEKMWTLGGSVSYYSAFCRCAESLSLASTSRGETDRQGEGERRGRRRRAAASVGFTVATETMSSLLNTCFLMISHARIVHSQREIRFNTQPEPRDRPPVCMCVCDGGSGCLRLWWLRTTEAETQVRSSSLLWILADL